MRKIGAILGLALLLTACGRESRPQASPDGSTRTTPPPTSKPARTNTPPVVHAASLERFDACPPLLSHIKTEARKRVGPYGLPGGIGGGGDVAVMRTTGVAGASGAVAESADSSGPAPAPAAAAPLEYSATNVQERSVDEPDVIKTNGRHIFTIRPEPTDVRRVRLSSITASDGRPRLAGGVLLPLAANYELLMAGDRILAMSSSGYGVGFERGAVADYYAPGSDKQETIVAVVDISDPENMRIANKLVLEGTYASARMVGGVARIVLNATESQPDFEPPKEPTSGAAKNALARNKQLIERSGVDEWLPDFRLQDASGKLIDQGSLSTCSSTYHPKTFSGFGTTSVVTIDPADPNPRNSASVLGGAGTIYASTDNLYVATQRWPEAQPGVIDNDGAIGTPEMIQAPPNTQIHRFDISDETRAVYAASGEVKGTILNQWSLSEHAGHLRVATTEDRFNERGSDSSSFVTTFTASGPRLTQVGQVGGLGKTERIYGVRFIGDLGYVVTFRQVDPLYVIDLAEPAKPRVLGELKIPGYSAYLHPVGDGLLLGIGQDATDEGRALGTQVALFDVSNASAPKQVAKVRIASSHTPVEQDHHAFTWWEPTKLAIVPIDRYDENEGNPSHAAYAFRVADAKITETGRISHESHTSEEFRGYVPVQRSIVIGDFIYTLSAAGLMGSDLGSLDERGWVGFELPRS